MSDGVQGGFARTWRATILKERPLILPRLRYVYPREAEEVERGALEVLVQPEGGEGFLATCALGFADPAAPTGVWSCPDPGWLCAVAGGYAYLINTGRPEWFEQVKYRPVLGVHAVQDQRLLLFVGNQGIVAYGEQGLVWESGRLSDEGVMVTAIDDTYVRGTGWQLATDVESSFQLDLRDGTLT